MRQSVDAQTGPTLLCLDIIDPGALGRLLAAPIKQQLPWASASDPSGPWQAGRLPHHI